MRLTLDEGAGEEYEDVFMRFNESYHSLKYLHTDKLQNLMAEVSMTIRFKGSYSTTQKDKGITIQKR